MLQNARVTDFTLSELLRGNQQGGGVKLQPPPPPGGGLKITPPPPPTTTTQIRVKKEIFLIEWSKVLNKVKVPPCYFVKLGQITFRIHDVEGIHFFITN